MDDPRTIRLGRTPYPDAYQVQVREHERVLAARTTRPEIGSILAVEHDPVITVTNRPGAAGHVLASPELLASQGVERVETDRGGDVTYHGPGQLVVYPVVDLNRMNLRLHDYLRLLEDAVMEVCEGWGLATVRDTEATGVWTRGPTGEPVAKVCAIGIRVRRWVTLHGLALNVSPDLAHFGLIVPCGLAGRPVTSLERELGSTAPTWEQAAETLTGVLASRFRDAADRADTDRAAAGSLHAS